MTAIEHVLDKVDLILVMTVNPGFGGQAFIPAQIEKIRAIRKMIGSRPIHLEVDGGINAGTVASSPRLARTPSSPAQACSGAASMPTISPPSARMPSAPALLRLDATLDVKVMLQVLQQNHKSSW